MKTKNTTMKNKLIFALFPLAFVLFSCSSEEDGDVPPELTLGTLELVFDNKVGDSDLVLNTETYTNSSGENYSVSSLRYIVSNIVLIGENGGEFVYPEDKSFFIVNAEDPASTKIQLDSIRGGDYAAIRFGIGVDQSMYPLNGKDNFIPKADELGMIWSWAAGYIFLMFEGEYTSDDTTEFKTFKYHMGSHGSNQDNYREVELQLPKNLSINDEAQAGLTLKTDVAKIFDSENTLSLDVKDNIQVDPENAPKIADNFSKTFSVLTVE